MSAEAGRFTTYLALVLAATAAVASAPGEPGGASRMLQWLVSAGTTAEAAVTASAIGGSMDRFEHPPCRLALECLE